MTVQRTVQLKDPFVHNVPVVPQDFVGREQTLTSIFEHLRNHNRANIAVYGPLGVGKTSLLNYVSNPDFAAQRGLDRETYILCQIDCQSLPGVTPSHLWRRLLRCMARKVDGRLHETVDRLLAQEEITFEDMQDLLDDLEDAGRVLIVLLDEFECLVRTHTELAERTTRHLLGMLSSLGRRAPRVLAMIIATQRSPVALSEDLEIWRGSPFSTIFVSLELKPFTESEADALIRQALAGTGMRFTHAERQLLYQQSEGHPAQLQAAAAALFEAKRDGSPEQEAQVVREAVAHCRSNGAATKPRGVWLDERTGDVWVDGCRPADLSNKEFSLLKLFHQNAGRVCSKDTIWSAVWPEYEGGVTDYAIHKMVSRLRQKIEPSPDNPQHILTVWGRGYKFVPN